MKLLASGSRVIDNSKLFSTFFFFFLLFPSVESKNRGRTFVDPKRNTELRTLIGWNDHFSPLGIRKKKIYITRVRGTRVAETMGKRMTHERAKRYIVLLIVLRFTETYARGSDASNGKRSKKNEESKRTRKRLLRNRRLFIYTANYCSFLGRRNSTAISIDG